jgi:hypothetical protein
VLVVSTGPGASKIIGIPKWMPFPERGGPKITIESSTVAYTATPREVPSRNPRSISAGLFISGRRVAARDDSVARPAPAWTSRRDAHPRRSTEAFVKATVRGHRHARTATMATTTTSNVQDQ